MNDLYDFENSRRGKRLRLSCPDVDWDKVMEVAHHLLRRKHNTLAAEQAVIAAIERLRTTARRLSHETGAENWSDMYGLTRDR